MKYEENRELNEQYSIIFPMEDSAWHDCITCVYKYGKDILLLRLLQLSRLSFQ